MVVDDFDTIGTSWRPDETDAPLPIDADVVILKDQPAGKYLDPLDDAMLPQMSDALLVMVQFDSALDAFRSRFLQRIGEDHHWITDELVNAWDEAGEEAEPDEEDDEGADD